MTKGQDPNLWHRIYPVVLKEKLRSGRSFCVVVWRDVGEALVFPVEWYLQNVVRSAKPGSGGAWPGQLNKEEFASGAGIEGRIRAPHAEIKQFLFENPELASQHLSDDHAIPSATLNDPAIIAALSATPGTPQPVTESGLFPSTFGKRLQLAFAAFRADPAQRYRLEVRRARSEQARVQLREPNLLSVRSFEEDFWNLESKTLIHRASGATDDITGRFWGDSPPGPEELQSWTDALHEGSMELHGSYIWGSASRVFASQFPQFSPEKKLELIRKIAEI